VRPDILAMLTTLGLKGTELLQEDWRRGRKATVTKYTAATFVSNTECQPAKSSLFHKASLSFSAGYVNWVSE